LQPQPRAGWTSPQQRAERTAQAAAAAAEAAGAFAQGPRLSHALQLAKVDPEEVNLWDFFHKSKHSSLEEQPEQSLDEANVYNNQDVALYDKKVGGPAGHMPRVVDLRGLTPAPRPLRPLTPHPDIGTPPSPAAGRRRVQGAAAAGGDRCAAQHAPAAHHAPGRLFL
jgi:hypothetical protein